mgnify:FL=1
MFEFLNRTKPDGAAVEVKASATGRVRAMSGAGRVAWSPRDVV